MGAINPISIEVLEILDAIDRRGSFAKAAEELNKATSAISYGVQKLEEQLDIALFQRQGRRSVLTPAGQVVLDDGRAILHASARLANRAQEVARGWETRIRIALESVAPHATFFAVLAEFLDKFPGIEVDVSECILNGGWEALEHDRVDLLLGAPGPVPRQKGFRAIALGEIDLVPVIAAHHPRAAIADDTLALEEALPRLRRVVTHDTSIVEVTRSEGLSDGGHKLYVQTIEQKALAILSGAGVGHLPRNRIQAHLDNGELLVLNTGAAGNHENFLAWKISNRGKGLQALTRDLAAASW